MRCSRSSPQRVLTGALDEAGPWPVSHRACRPEYRDRVNAGHTERAVDRRTRKPALFESTSPPNLDASPELRGERGCRRRRSTPRASAGRLACAASELPVVSLERDPLSPARLLLGRTMAPPVTGSGSSCGSPGSGLIRAASRALAWLGSRCSVEGQLSVSPAMMRPPTTGSAHPGDAGIAVTNGRPQARTIAPTQRGTRRP
jgi:hypothetical protein